jgi:hypothetical protein
MIFLLGDAYRSLNKGGKQSQRNGARIATQQFNRILKNRVTPARAVPSSRLAQKSLRQFD